MAAEVLVEAALVETPGWGSLWGEWKGRRVVAVGPAGERATLPESDLWSVPEGVEREVGLLVPYAAAAEAAAGSFRSATNVLVQAPFPSAPAVCAALRARGVTAATDPAAGPFDGFVGGGEAVSWGPGLARVRPGGEAVLLIPPGPARVDFNFYSQAHTRSLRLRAVRIPRPLGPGDDPRRLVEGARRLLAEMGLAVEGEGGALWDLRDLRPNR